MRALAAIVGDALRELRARRVSRVVLALGGAVAVAFAALAPEPVPAEAFVDGLLAEVLLPAGWSARGETRDGASTGGAILCALELSGPASLDAGEARREAEALGAALVAAAEDRGVEVAEAHVAPAAAAAAAAALTLHLELHPGDRLRVAGLCDARLAWARVPLVDRGGRPFSYRLLLAVLLLAVADALVGGVGVAIGLLATVSLAHDLTRPEMARVLFARPTARATIWCGRWLAGVVFVLAHALGFVLLVGLAVGARSGVWEAGLAPAALAGVGLFAVLSAVAGLASLAFRSLGLGILAALVVWFAGAVAAPPEERLEPIAAPAGAATAAPSAVERTAAVIAAGLPRTAEVRRLNERLLVRDHEPAWRGRRGARAPDRPLDAARLLVPALAWLAGALALGGAVLARREV